MQEETDRTQAFPLVRANVCQDELSTPQRVIDE
jgi:hypothetical protein